MSAVDTLLDQAITAYQAGDVETARSLLLRAVEQDERNVQVWWWLSATVETLEEQQICLENVLALDPNHSRARHGLDALSRQIAAQGGAASPSKGLPPWFQDGGSTAPIGAEFDMLSGDSLIDSLRDVQVKPGVRSPGSQGVGDDLFSDWLAEAAAQEPQAPPARKVDPFAPATSVDWGRDDAPAAYGSGRHVDLPSDEEYDRWVQGLNLGDGPSTASGERGTALSPSPFSTGGPPPFAAFDGDDGSRLPPMDAAPTPESDPFADYVELEAPPPQPEPAARPVTPPPFAAATLSEDDPFWDMGEAAFRASADDAPAAPAAHMPAAPATPSDAPAPKAEGPIGRGSKPTLDPGDYYRYIPKDIEAPPGASVTRLVGVALLLVLNLLSLGYLVLSLAR